MTREIVREDKDCRIIPGNSQHIGSREEQQDSFGLSDIDNWEFVKSSGVIAVVADGMGGMRAGREASSIVVASMLESYSKKAQDEAVSPYLKRSVLSSNEAVLDMARKEGLEWQTGSTLVAAVIKGNELYYASVGDSRIYLFRKRSLAQLTADHIFARELYEDVAAGRMSREEAAVHPDRNKLTSYIGKPGLDEIDCNESPIILKPGDRVMLCSDGIYGSLTNSEMCKLLDDYPQLAAEAMIQKVLQKNRSHQDNMTVVILAYE